MRILLVSTHAQSISKAHLDGAFSAQPSLPQVPSKLFAASVLSATQTAHKEIITHVPVTLQSQKSGINKGRKHCTSVVYATHSKICSYSSKSAAVMVQMNRHDRVPIKLY